LAATLYPAFFNAMDMAAPMPRVPPVTTATLLMFRSLFVFAPPCGEIFNQ
jgi:hypothetical protein